MQRPRLLTVSFAIGFPFLGPSTGSEAASAWIVTSVLRSFLASATATLAPLLCPACRRQTLTGLKDRICQTHGKRKRGRALRPLRAEALIFEVCLRARTDECKETTHAETEVSNGGSVIQEEQDPKLAISKVPARMHFNCPFSNASVDRSDLVKPHHLCTTYTVHCEKKASNVDSAAPRNAVESITSATVWKQLCLTCT